jgi:tetratricopeptide (TPR) repeat protein
MIGNAQKKALIIGISDYTDPGLERLSFCRSDGEKMYEVLKKQDYNISEECMLVGEVNWGCVRETIYDFFGDIESNPDDTLLFYYSGHGVLDDDGEIYLASSDIDPDEPYRRGFAFEELTKMIRKSIPIGVVIILDCCYSGSAKMGKGSEEDAARKGRITMEEKSRKLSEVQGKYILSASQALQEAYALREEEQSIYTHYLVKGLEINAESIDSDGNVTPPSLHKYVYREIMRLPFHKRPRQKPGIQGSGNIVLVSSKLGPPPHPENPIPGKGILGSKTKILIAVLATVIAIAFTSVLFTYYNHSTTIKAPTNVSAAQMLINKKYALYEKGNALNNLGNYTEAIPYLDKALDIDPDFEDALNDKGWALEDLGNYTGAIKYLNKALGIAPNDKYALNNIGWALYRLGNYTGAIKYYDEALALDRNYELALDNKGEVLLNLGNITGAMSYFDQAIAVTPNDKYALKDKGQALANLRNYTGAIKYYDEALALDRNFEDALNFKGAALADLGNYKEAIIYFDKALAIDPKLVEALNNKGSALAIIGNYTGAIEYFDKALAIDPHNGIALFLKTTTQQQIAQSKHYPSTLHAHNITHNFSSR